MSGDNSNNGDSGDGNTGNAGGDGGSSNSGNRNDDSNYWRERSQRFESKLTDSEKRLSALEGIDRDEYSRLKEEEERRRKDGLKTPDEIEAYAQEKVDAVKAEFGKKFDSFESDLSAKDRLLKELQVHNVAKEKASGIIDMDCWPLIKPFIDRHCFFEDEEIIIKDDEGNVRSSPDNPRYNMTMDEYLAEFVQKQPKIAVDKGKKGTATSVGNSSDGSSNLSGSMTLQEFAKLSEQDRKAQPLEVRQKFQSEMFNTQRAPRVKASDLMGAK